MCLFKFDNNKKYEICYFCKNSIDECNPYLFKIVGLGKYDNKYICIDCIIDKLIK